MASLISIATGNFTASGTWGLVDSTSFLDSEAGSTASTTSFVYSATFVPGAITVDGIAVKVANRTASPTGTMTIELNNITDGISVASLAINATDIANTNSAVAYYEGGGALLQMAKSTEPQVRDLYDQVARWVISRQPQPKK